MYRVVIITDFSTVCFTFDYLPRELYFARGHLINYDIMTEKFGIEKDALRQYRANSLLFDLAFIWHSIFIKCETAAIHQAPVTNADLS
jgi:hypothetical protein